MTLTFPSLGLANLFTRLAGPAAPRATFSPDPAAEAEEARARRDALMDLIDRNAEALFSEQDIAWLLRASSTPR